MSSLSSFPLGVDLVEIKKAKSFYDRHKENLGSYFTKREILEIRRSKKPHVQMALALAVKEAMFKARRARSSRSVRLSFVKKKDYVIALAYGKKNHRIGKCAGIS